MLCFFQATPSVSTTSPRCATSLDADDVVPTYKNLLRHRDTWKRRRPKEDAVKSNISPPLLVKSDFYDPVTYVELDKHAADVSKPPWYTAVLNHPLCSLCYLMSDFSEYLSFVLVLHAVNSGMLF